MIVADQNQPVKHLYQKLGYRIIAARPIVPCPGFAHEGDWLLMEKPLTG